MESNIKTEPEREVEPSLFVDDAAQPAQPSSEVIYKPLWKKRQDTLLQRVEVEEQSLLIAIPQVLDLRSKISEYAETIPSVRIIVDQIESTLARNEKCRITAGAIAPTGMGKSSAWNAVLGFPELLPTDNGHACTSAIIEVLWNSNNDAAAAFHAEIFFLKESEWQMEIEQLFKDLEALARKNAGAGDDLDVELESRIDSVMEKLRAVYPFIDSRQDLQRHSLAKLMNYENVNDLGKELKITDADLRQFSSKIRPYLVSSAASKKFALWPLVKVAKIYVKSEILKDGLVLVDIPGSMDTNAARNSLAEAYQRQLSVTCILTASTRAASDQIAQICLNETLQRHLQLDGRWKSENVIFIVVRKDESITIDDHISKNPALANHIQHLFDKEKAYNMRKSAIQQEICATAAGINKAKKDIKNLTKQLNELWSWLNEIPQIRSAPRAVKSKAGSELLKEVLASTGLSEETLANAQKLDKLRADRVNARKQRDNGYGKMNGKQSELKQVDTVLERIKCAMLRACIDHRSQMQCSKIREYFDRILKETGKTANPKSLSVLCVSAAKFLDFLEHKPPSLGFPLPSSTGIPQLRRALVNTTLEARHQIAKTKLEQINALLSLVHSWAKSLNSSYQMKYEQREQLEQRLGEAADVVLESFSQLNITTVDSIRSAIQSKIFKKKLRAFERMASSNSPAVSDKWAREFHWSTYRATVTRLGEFRSCVRQTAISWNEELSANFFTEPMKKLWTKLFDCVLPPIQNQVNEAVKSLLADFTQTVTELVDKICPEIKDSLRSITEGIAQQGLILQGAYILTWNATIASGRADAHRLVKPQILKFMTGAYEKAALETGTGFKRRVQRILRDHLQHHALTMYEQSSTTLIVALKKMTDELKEGLDNQPTEFVGQAREMFCMMLDNHKPANRFINQKALGEAKDRLLKDVTRANNHLMSCLEDNVNIAPDKNDELPPTYDVDEEVNDFDSSDFDGDGSGATTDDDD